MRAILVWALLALGVSACGAIGPVTETATVLTPTPFPPKPGDSGSGGSGGGPTFGDKLGLNAANLPDAACATPSPKAGHPVAALQQTGAEPEVVLGTTAFFTDVNQANEAYDLATQKTLWTVGDSRRLTQLSSDGTRVCGKGEANDFACLDHATGKDLWRVPAFGTEYLDSYLLGSGVAFLSTAVPGNVSQPPVWSARAVSLTDGKVRWKAPGKLLALVGSQLIVDTPCAGGSGYPACAAAIDLESGTETPITPASNLVQLLWTGAAGTFFYDPDPNGIGKGSVLGYDAATHSVTDVTSRFTELFAQLQPQSIIYPLSPVLGDGSLYVSLVVRSIPTTLCRVDTATIHTVWCVSSGAGAVRVHPNAVFLSGFYESDRAVLNPADGTALSDFTFERWFGRWGFANQNVVVEP